MELGLTAQIVGSYHKPRWLVREDKVGAGAEFWRPDPADLPAAHDDATRLAVADQELAGMAVVTDGEQRRDSFVRYFDRLEGIDRDSPVERPRKQLDYVETAPAAQPRQRHPRVTGPVRWVEPMTVADLQFVRRYTRLPVKMTVVGPVTLAVRLVDEYYGDLGQLIEALAAALNQELLALQAAGVDIVQLDEPELHFSYETGQRYGAAALERAFAGIEVHKAVHVCYGYARFAGEKQVDPRYGGVLELLAVTPVDDISLEYEQPGHGPELLRHAGDKGLILGLLNLAREVPETPEHIEARARAALEVVPPGRLRLGPDCGMWFLDRPSAFARLAALAEASRRLRRDHR